MHFWEISSRLL